MSGPQVAGEKLLAWGLDGIDDKALEQARRTARLPFIAGHVALMPDAHWGMGSTVGSVIPTAGAIVPAAIGVDIGCGVIAADTGIHVDQLPDSLGPLLTMIEQSIPAGVGQGHEATQAHNCSTLVGWPSRIELTDRQRNTAAQQLGTLGSGNHFVEVSVDEHGQVWAVLHSGSRGIGNQLASHHIERARKLMKDWFVTLEDPDLAYLPEGTPEFDDYMDSLLWAQQYARVNRELMMDRVLSCLAEVVAPLPVARDRRINSHHNYTELEQHRGVPVWVTRKGAIRARHSDYGVIPGSMGTSTFIVAGKGSAASYQSCAHGAGRRLSRGQAKRELTVATLRDQMKSRTWLDEHAKELLDESPDAYKNVDEVMDAQSDLVEVVHRLDAVLNYKGIR